MALTIRSVQGTENLANSLEQGQPLQSLPKLMGLKPLLTKAPASRGTFLDL